MKNFTIHYSKTRNGAKLYVVEISECQDRKDAINTFYSWYPKYHIRKVIENN